MLGCLCTESAPYTSSYIPSMNIATNFASISLRGFTERSYIHANWYTKAGYHSETRTDPTLL